MKITLRWLKSLKKLHQYNDTYGYSWEVYGDRTLFRIKDNGGAFFTVTLHQKYYSPDYINNILLGKINTQEELIELFKIITRGENLK